MRIRNGPVIKNYSHVTCLLRVSAGVLEHGLRKYFPELLKFESTAEMEASVLYATIRPEVDRILSTIVLGKDSAASAPAGSSPGRVSALALNIERGNRFSGIVHALKNHPQLKARD